MPDWIVMGAQSRHPRRIDTPFSYLTELKKQRLADFIRPLRRLRWPCAKYKPSRVILSLVLGALLLLHGQPQTPQRDTQAPTMLGQLGGSRTSRSSQSPLTTASANLP